MKLRIHDTTRHHSGEPFRPGPLRRRLLAVLVLATLLAPGCNRWWGSSEPSPSPSTSPSAAASATSASSPSPGVASSPAPSARPSAAPSGGSTPVAPPAASPASPSPTPVESPAASPASPGAASSSPSPEGSPAAGPSASPTPAAAKTGGPRALKQFKMAGVACRFEVSPDEQILAGLGEAETTPDGKSTCYVHIVSFPSGQERLKLPVGRSPAEWASFSPNGRVLAVSVPEESLVIAWDTDTWQEIWRVKLAGPHRLDFTRLGRLMIVETTDNKLHLVDLKLKKVVQVLAGTGPAFSAEGDLLAGCDRTKGKLLCWRVSAPGSPARVASAPSPRRAIGFYAADGVVVAGDKGVYGVDLTAGKSRQIHGGACDDAALSRDGRNVALPQDDAVVVKRLKDSQVVARVPLQASLALVLKSGRIVTSRKASDGSGAIIEVWAGLSRPH